MFLADHTGKLDLAIKHQEESRTEHIRELTSVQTKLQTLEGALEVQEQKLLKARTDGTNWKSIMLAFFVPLADSDDDSPKKKSLAQYRKTNPRSSLAF